MEAPSDAELMARVRGGDRAAFAALVDRHKNRLVNYLIRLTGCRDRAEDNKTQVVFQLFNGFEGIIEIFQQINRLI